MITEHNRAKFVKPKGRFKRYFVTGLLVVVPLYITIYVLLLVAGIMDSAMDFLPRFMRPHSYLPFHIPGLGIVVSVLVIAIIGMFAQNFVGRRLVEFSERFMVKIPFVRVIYNATKQFLDTFLNKGHQGFNKVVLFEFPRKEVWALGFMTGDTKGELKDRATVPMINVFLPTTPNPTSGFYIMVPKSEAIELDMHIEDAFKVIMTGGIVVPEQFGVTLPGEGKEKKTAREQAKKPRKRPTKSEEKSKEKKPETVESKKAEPDSLASETPTEKPTESAGKEAAKSDTAK
jgi:uncharacterized membrane protein